MGSGPGRGNGVHSVNRVPQPTILLFHDLAHADAALAYLLANGFDEHAIGVLAGDPQGGRLDRRGHLADAGYGEQSAAAIAGVGIGGLVELGVLTGYLIGLGWVLAAGTVAGLLQNALQDRSSRDLHWVLLELGVEPDASSRFVSELLMGRCLVTVAASNRGDDANRILVRHGGYAPN
jgi:hypothetical protein